MRYENPDITEGINYTQEHPLKEFAQLVVGIVVVVALVVFILNLSTTYLSRFIPFEYEVAMVENIEIFEGELNSESLKTRARLQTLADRLSANMALPANMRIKVHYSDSDTVNAFATLGGNLMFFKGLLDEIESEQELAAVMAHEVAHIKHRHPVVALGKGFTLATVAGVVGAATGSHAAEWLIGSSINLSLLQFSRDQEAQADTTAGLALYKTYGDIHGAEKLFARFAMLEEQHIDTSAGLEIFRSHPYSDNRWRNLKRLAEKNSWPTKGELSPWH